MKRVLVIGDTIVDEYIFGHAARLCPEGPVPVIVPQRTETRGGGARLVANQLEILIGEENVMFLSGSQSKKKRIFADDHLICRLDEDSLMVSTKFEDFVLEHMLGEHGVFYDLLVISDYGKGALTQESTSKILDAADGKMQVLVDAKNNFWWYQNVFAYFPNEYEATPFYPPELPPVPPFVIKKLGPRGCSVNGQIVPLENEHPVKDVTGAGDCFLAAFAAKMAAGSDDLIECAKFANRVAARSVEFVGTKIVTDVALGDS